MPTEVEFKQLGVKVFICSYFLIVLAEILILLNRYISLLLYSVVILAVLFYLTITRGVYRCRSAISILLLPILRFVNLSTPVFFPYTIYWLPIVYLPIFLSIYTIIRALDLKIEEIGFSLKKLYIYIPFGVIIGFLFAIVEFKILKPNNLIPIPGLTGFLTLFIVMFMFVAFAEELMFRSVLQTSFEKDFGLIKGLILAAGLFAIVHIKYGLLEFVFTFFAGLIIGYLFQKTRSLPFVVMIRGTADVMIFGVFHMIGLRI